MNIPVTADHIAVAVCAAAKVFGEDPIKAWSVQKGPGRSSIVAGASAVADYAHVSNVKVCKVLTISANAISNGKANNARFWEGYHAAFGALEQRFGPQPPEPPKPAKPAAPPKAAKAPAPKPLPAPPAPVAAAPEAAVNRGRSEAPGAGQAVERQAFTRPVAQRPAVEVAPVTALAPARAPQPQTVYADGYSAAEQTLIAELYAEGASGSDIVRGLWDKLKVRRTRKAIISYIHRRVKRREPGLVAKISRARATVSGGAVTSIQEARERRRSAAAAAPAIEPVGGAPVGKLWPVGPGACGLMALPAGGCRWPVGVATGAEQLFCAEPAAAEGAPYCGGHLKASWGPIHAANWDAKRLKRIPA